MPRQEIVRLEDEGARAVLPGIFQPELETTVCTLVQARSYKVLCRQDIHLQLPGCRKVVVGRRIEACRNRRHQTVATSPYTMTCVAWVAHLTVCALLYHQSRRSCRSSEVSGATANARIARCEVVIEDGAQPVLRVQAHVG